MVGGPPSRSYNHIDFPEAQGEINNGFFNPPTLSICAISQIRQMQSSTVVKETGGQG